MSTPKNAVMFFIQRKRAIPVTGNVSHITQWDVWSEHDTEEDRDAALKKLREEHPMWRLRARQWNPYFASIGLSIQDND